MKAEEQSGNKSERDDAASLTNPIDIYEFSDDPTISDDAIQRVSPP